eukprot:gene16668-19807_t
MSNTRNGSQFEGFKRASAKLPASMFMSNSAAMMDDDEDTPPPPPPRPTAASSSDSQPPPLASVDDFKDDLLGGLDPVPITRTRTNRAKTMISSDRVIMKQSAPGGTGANRQSMSQSMTIDPQQQSIENEPVSRRGTYRKAIVIGSHVTEEEDPLVSEDQRISSLDLANVQRPKQQYHTIDPASIPQWKRGTVFSSVSNTFSSLLSKAPAKPAPATTTSPARTRADIEYNEYLERSRIGTFPEIESLNFIYQAGKDNLGRTIIVIIASNLPAKKIDMDRVLLYTISIMDPVVERDYVLCYVHTNMSNDNKPSFAWLKKVYSIFNRKYKKNLKGLYIVHPTTWIKFTLRLFKPFISSKFWLKLTYIDDLSDLFKVFSKEQLSLPNHIMMHKPAGRKAQPIFGAPLEEVVNRPDNPSEIPVIVEKGLVYLEKRALKVEGIFRLSGANSQIKSLKQCYDSGEDVDLDDCEDVHTVAGLLKLYLRELPQPLFPYDTYSSFLEISKGDAPRQQKVDSLKLLISLLPPANRAVSRHLFKFLDKVLQNSGHNKMNAVNLSIVFAPNLLKDQDQNVMNVVADAQYVNQVVQLLLENINYIIIVRATRVLRFPQSFVSLVRFAIHK